MSAPPPAAPGGAPPIVMGIDIAARRPCVAVALQMPARTGRVVGWMEADHRHPGETARLLQWVEALSPAVVAIDAPQAPNRHLMKGSRLRVCDWELRRRGLPLYQVPARGQPAPEWIAVGFEYFRLLKHRGFEMAAAHRPAPGLRRCPGAAGGVSLRRLRLPAAGAAPRRRGEPCRPRRTPEPGPACASTSCGPPRSSGTTTTITTRSTPWRPASPRGDTCRARPALSATPSRASSGCPITADALQGAPRASSALRCPSQPGPPSEHRRAARAPLLRPRSRAAPAARRRFRGEPRGKARVQVLRRSEGGHAASIVERQHQLRAREHPGDPARRRHAGDAALSADRPAQQGAGEREAGQRAHRPGGPLGRRRQGLRVRGRPLRAARRRRAAPGERARRRRP